MPIVLKTSSEIEQMRRTAWLAVQIVSKMQRAAIPGATTVAR